MSRTLVLGPRALRDDLRRRGGIDAAGRDARPTAVILHDAVAADAPADEQDTLAQAAAVRRALETLGYRAESLTLGADPRAAVGRLQELGPAVVFNLVESVASSGRLIHLAPTLLEALGVPFTGADSSAMLTTSNKVLAKRLMKSAGIPTPAWLEPDVLLQGEAPVDGRHIVKSVWEHASIGIDAGSIAADARGLAAIARDRRGRLGGEWFAERFVDGREFNIALLAGPDGPRVLPIAEMCFVDYPEHLPKIVDYRAKWAVDSFEYRNTQRRFDLPITDSLLLDRLTGLARACWRLFGLNGHARVDIRLDGDGRPWVLEVNANPCLASDAGFVAAAEMAGLDLVPVVGAILEDLSQGARGAVSADRRRWAQARP